MNQTMLNVDPLENLLPSLVQCFSVIFIGYLAVRWSLIDAQAKALGTYVTKFALPALFFRSMATIDFYDVNWLFILAVSLGKLLLFILTIFFTLLITKPINFGMAGILSMFITQSNDVALGYPILLSLYPDLAKYIYLFAPTQLVFINTLCFILIEWHEHRQGNTAETGTYTSVNRRILLVLKNVVLNPLVYMTVIGIIFNFILSHRLPLIIDKTLEIFANSFSGVALFYLGMNMVGKLNNINKHSVYILVFILLGKLVFLPFLTRELVVHLVGIQLLRNESLNYSLMGFFYGGLPTAPPVFLIASTFNILPDVIATGLVVGTFLSGPLMFITGRMVTMVITSKYQYDSILQSTSIGVSSLSIFGCVWVLVVILLSRRLRSPIHKVTICYTICVLLLCLGLVIGRIFLPAASHKEHSIPGWGSYVQFAIFYIGCIGARLWTCLIAFSLAIIERKSLEFLEKKMNYFYLFGFCVPIFITSTILIFAKKQEPYDIDPLFQFGRIQIIGSIVVLAGSIFATLLFFVIRVRFRNQQMKSSVSVKKSINNDINARDTSDECNNIINSDDSLSNKALLRSDRRSHESEANYERVFTNEMDSEDEITNWDLPSYRQEFQVHQHLALTIILVVTMGFGFFLCLWRLINEDVSGIYVELKFLDCVFNFGQGFLLWAIFGLDTQLIVLPLKRRIMVLRQYFHKLQIPKEENLSQEVCRIRDTFLTYHIDNCRNEITRDIRQHFQLYRNVFSGHQLIDWILKIELEDNRLQAQAYAQVLLISRVIEHVRQNNNLVDDDEYLYRFVEPQLETHLESGGSENNDF